MKKRGFGVGKRNGAGGKVEQGESLVASAIRELKEETDITLQESDLTLRGVNHFFFPHKPEWSQSVHIFVGNYSGDFAETEEMKPQWWPIDQIPYHEMRDDDKVWLPRVLAGESVEYEFFFDPHQKIEKYEKIK